MPEDHVSADLLHQRVRTELEALDLDARALRTPALLAAIRRRRHAAGWGAAGAGVLLAAGVVALLPSDPPTTVLPGGTVTPDRTQSRSAPPEATLPRCGQPVSTRPGVDGLTTPPGEASLGGPGIVGLTFTLTNTTGAPLKGTTGHVVVTVVQEGRIVALPPGARLIAFGVDLAPGASMALTGDVALQDCRAAGREPGSSGKQPVDAPAVTLPAGTYQLYATVTVVPHSGRATTVRGGPWPLTLR